MIDAVDRLIIEREAMDRGMPESVIISIGGHGLLFGALLMGHLLRPSGPVLNVMPAFAVALPRGGGGTPNPAPVAPSATQPKEEPSEAPPAPEPVKILKPPKDEPPKDALPELDAKRPKQVPKTPPPRSVSPPGRSTAETKPTPASGSGGAGTSPALPGLEFGPPGPGVPGGSDSGGDWYLASVQQKIWILWTQQMKSGFNQPIGVTFTILADGSVTDVQLTQPSNVAMLNLAAQRAVTSAGPFAPLPKSYGTNRYTIQATFKPTP